MKQSQHLIAGAGEGKGSFSYLGRLFLQFFRRQTMLFLNCDFSTHARAAFDQTAIPDYGIADGGIGSNDIV